MGGAGMRCIDIGELVSVERLHELFELGMTSGELTWKVTRGGAVAGSRAGFTREGYACVQIEGHDVAAHRVIYAMVSGAWPIGDVDHRNGDRLDNRPGNLRCATRSQNVANQALRACNTSGFKGVSWDKKNKKWMARIGVNGKSRTLGRYACAEDAGRAYDRAAVEAFGEFAATNEMLRAGVR
jgi:hypothetical protein